jgi:hypothetical protein
VARFPRYDIILAMEDPANAGILTYFESRPGTVAGVNVSRAPNSVPQPSLTLGTHPDLVERLWDTLTALLPEACQWVVYGRPALVHPGTGVIFGFAQGTHAYALRLPQPERDEAVAAGAKAQYVYPSATLDLSAAGDEWLFGCWHPDEPRWCLAAYEAAGRLC